MSRLYTGFGRMPPAGSANPAGLGCAAGLILPAGGRAVAL